MEEEILKSFLDKKVTDAKNEIKEKGILSEENALYLIMDFLFNHVSSMKKNMATKDDIKNMATKDDIKNMAKQEDVKRNEWKLDDAIKNMATKDDLYKLEKNMVTKDDLYKLEKNMVTKDDLRRVENIILFAIALLALIIALLQIFVVR